MTTVATFDAPTTPSAVWWRRPVVWLGVSAAVFYWTTSAPSLVWADGGRLQTEAIVGRSIYLSFPELDRSSSDGGPFDLLGVAAWDHPLWVMLGHGVTRLPGDPTHLLNLLSAVFAVAALIVMHQVMLTLTGEPLAAAVGAGALAVSHTFWFHAVTAEVYTLHVLFMGSLLLIGLQYARTRRWWLLVLFAFLTGLGTANHVMLALTAIPVAAFLVAQTRDDGAASPIGTERADQVRWRRPLLLVVAFVVGLAPWWIQFVRMARFVGVRTTALTALGFPWVAGRFPGPIGMNTLANLVEYVVLLTYQFTPIGVTLGVLGAIELRRRSRTQARLVLVLFLVHAVFSSNYDVPDRFTFHIGSFAIFSLFIAAGVARSLELVRRTAPRRLPPALGAAPARHAAAAAALAGAIAVPVAVYNMAPGFVTRFGLEDSVAVPDIGRGARDGLRYFLNPNKRGDDSASSFGRKALLDVDPNAIVIAAWPGDQEAYVVLRHFQLVEGLRPDVHLDLALFADGSTVEDRVGEIVSLHAACRPVYLASTDPDTYPLELLSVRFDIEPDGMLYRLRPRQDVPADVGPCPPAPGAPIGPSELVERATHA